jgi:hypothetical protein
VITAGSSFEQTGLDQHCEHSVDGEDVQARGGCESAHGDPHAPSRVRAVGQLAHDELSGPVKSWCAAADSGQPVRGAGIVMGSCPKEYRERC